MPPKSTVQKKNKRAAEIRWRKAPIQEQEEEEEINEDCEPNKIPADIAVISTFIEGSNYNRARMSSATRGQRFPSKSTFFRCQKKLIPLIEEKTKEMIYKTGNDILQNREFDLSVDGCYPTVRDSCQCTVAGMDCTSNKVVDVVSVSKQKMNVSSNLLE